MVRYHARVEYDDVDDGQDVILQQDNENVVLAVKEALDGHIEGLGPQLQLLLDKDEPTTDYFFLFKGPEISLVA